MGRDQHDIDELARMERICLDLADGAVMPEERAELAIMAGNYRAAILHIKTGNAFADTEVFCRVLFLPQAIEVTW